MTRCGHWKILRKAEVKKFLVCTKSVIKSIELKMETFFMHEAGTSEMKNTDIF
jgi:hypothetical protein